jgi:DNA-binding transcriptional LysR family regulator
VPQDSKEPDLLRNGTLDLDIGIAGVQPADIHTSMLLTEHFVVVVAINSELGRAGQLTIDDLSVHPHIPLCAATSPGVPSTMH